VLDLIERDGVIAANERKAGRFFEMASALAHHPRVRDFRHLGMIWAFEVAGESPGFASRAFEIALARGVLLRPIGRTVYFMPPYVVERRSSRCWWKPRAPSWTSWAQREARRRAAVDLVAARGNGGAPGAGARGARARRRAGIRRSRRW
jgi:hypothetical protein